VGNAGGIVLFMCNQCRRRLIMSAAGLQSCGKEKKRALLFLLIRGVGMEDASYADIIAKGACAGHAREETFVFE
jgi:hypothetical protein